MIEVALGRIIVGLMGIRWAVLSLLHFDAQPEPKSIPALKRKLDSSGTLARWGGRVSWAAIACLAWAVVEVLIDLRDITGAS